MKDKIHPKVSKVIFKDISCDFAFLGESTVDSKETMQWEDGKITPEEIKEVYFQFLSIRLSNANIFIKQAQDARTTLI